MDLQGLLEHFLTVRRVSTDTRNIQPGDIFFALKGERFDGNQYASQALEAGASLAVVDDPGVATDERFVLVENSLSTLQELATAYRRTHSATFIGITGSNGKTTTKELMRDVLAQKFRTQATEGNFNNHIGVPLTLLSIQPDTEMAIIEMGANHQGEIALLSSIAEPDAGTITNIGKAHLEGFGGILGVKKGKGELFRFLENKSRPAFVNTDLEHLSDIAPPKTYAYNRDSLGIALKTGQRTLSFSWSDSSTTHQVNTQLTGDYNLPNCMIAIKVGLHYGVGGQQITAALNAYVPENQRSQLQQTASNLLILDAYNANPTSISAALENLASMDGDRFFILGDMFELGDETNEAHQGISDQAIALGLDGYLVGEHFSKVTGPFSSFPSTADLGDFLKGNPISNRTILVKGSRGMKLESLIDLL